MNRHAGSGGAFTYAKAAFGYDHGFLCAWFVILTYVAILWANATAVVLIIRNLSGGVLQLGFHYRIAGYDVYFGEAAVSVGAVLLCGAICIRSKTIAGAIQTVMAVTLFAGIVFCLFIFNSKVGGQNTLEPLFAPGKSMAVQLMKVAALVPWAFVGFESVSHSRAEFRFSVKKSFIIIAAAVITSGLAYALLTWLAAFAQPEGYRGWLSYIYDLRKMEGLKSVPVFFAMETVMGHTGFVILAVMLLAAVFTGIIGNYIAASRLLYVLAGEGILPRKFHELNRHNSPAKCIMLIMAFSVFIPFLGRTAVGWIVDVTSVGTAIAYGYTSAAALKAARGEGDLRAECIGGLGLIFSVGFYLLAIAPNLWEISTMSAESYLILTIWGMLGLTFFRFIVANDQKERFGKSGAVWIVILFMLLFLSTIWMRQSIHQDMERVIDSGFVHEVLHSSLVRNSMIQITVCLLSTAILFNIFSIENKRQKALEAARIVAEKANAAKSEFLASMSHEIRTPINAVLGMNEMIIRESRDKHITTYARNVESAGKNLLSIINDILDFSKIEAGRMEIVNADYKLSSVLNDVTNMIMFKAEQKRLDFNIDVDMDMPDGLYGDQVRVRQTVVNVLNNAVKYTDKGSVTLSVGGRREGGIMNLKFVVKDTGIGIKPEDMPKLFVKFQRVDLERNSTVEGTGLGLSITRNLLRMMGGDVSVESEYGKGSTFTITLPQRIVSDEPIGDFHEKFEQYVHSMKAYHESFRAPEARILVVDDTDMNLTVVEGLLARTEVKIDKASSGAEALAMTQRVRYDLVLMDHRMPQMDGSEALRRLRRQEDGLNRETPVICLTADAVSGARERYIGEGFTDYLSKPIEGAAIEAALIKYLPPSKVTLHEETEEEAPSERVTELEAFYSDVEELNYADAIRFCSNEDVLKKTLEQFYRSIKPNSNAIDGFLMEKDYKNYTIKVHALKSSARLIGAAALSADALYLEELGNSLTGEDIKRIEELTPKLLADYRRFLDILSPLYAQEQEAREAAPEISAAELSEAYEAIRQFIEGFDIDAIDGFIAEVRKYRIPKIEEARFALVEECVRNMDWNALEEALRL